METGHAVCVGGGVGTAVILPIAQGLHRAGVNVTSIIGGRSREWVILEDELRANGEVITCTDDGSYGRHGFVTQARPTFWRTIGRTSSTPSARCR